MLRLVSVYKRELTPIGSSVACMTALTSTRPGRAFCARRNGLGTRRTSTPLFRCEGYDTVPVVHVEGKALLLAVRCKASFDVAMIDASIPGAVLTSIAQTGEFDADLAVSSVGHGGGKKYVVAHNAHEPRFHSWCRHSLPF